MEVAKLSDLLGPAKGGTGFNQTSLVSVPTSTVKAQIFSTEGTVTLVGSGTAAQSAVSATSGAMTLAQMATLGWIDPAIVRRLPAISFSHVEFGIDAATRIATITAPWPTAPAPIPWPLPFATLTLVLRVLVSGTGKQAPLSAVVNAMLGAGGANAAVDLSFPTDHSPWTLTLAEGAAPQLSDLAAALQQLTGFPAGSLLPPGLPGGFAITRLDSAFDSAHLYSTTLTIGSTQPWTIVGPLVLQSLALQLSTSLAFDESGASTIWLSGMVTGTVTLFNAKITVTAPLDKTGRLEIVCYPSLILPGIGQLAADLAGLLGVSSLGDYFPRELMTLGSIQVDRLTFSLNLKASTASAKLTDVSVQLSLPDDVDWKIPYLSGLTLEELRLSIDSRQPLLSTRQTGGRAELLATIGEAQVVISIERPQAESICSLSLQSPTTLRLADLLTLINLDGAAFNAMIPARLSIVSDLGLSTLDAVYDLDAALLSEIGFTIELSDTWKIIPGKLEIPALSLSLDVVRYPPENGVTPASQVLATASAEIEIGGAGFLLLATNDQPNSTWRLVMELRKNSAINLTDLLGSLLPGARLSDIFPAFSINAAHVELIPSTLEIHSTLQTSVQWKPTFAGQQGSVANIALALDVEAQKKDNTRPWKFSVAGALSMPSLPVFSVACVTGSSSTETVLLGTVAAPSQFELGSVTGKFTGGANWKGVKLPPGFVPPELAQAGIYLNLTTSTLMLFGRTSFGNAGLFIRNTAAASAPALYDYAFVVNIEKGFKFENIATGLKALDGFISIQQASIAVSSFTSTDPAANPYAVLATLTAAGEKLAPALPPATSTRPGLNVDGTLQFTGTGIWENLKWLIEARASAAIYVHATVDPQAPANTVFQAALGGFVILQTLTFDKVAVTYAPNAAIQLVMDCSGSVSVPSHASDTQEHDALFKFTGNLTVTQTGAVANFNVAAGATLSRPLGIPSIVMHSLSMRAEWAFTGNSRSLTLYELQGKFTLLDVADLTAGVLFLSNQPRVVKLTLNKPVSLRDVLSTIGVAALCDSPLVPKLTFKTGDLYYAKTAVTAPKYDQGFHLAADADIFSATFHVTADLTDKKGMTGTALASAPVEVLFVTLTGPEGTGGPGLSITVNDISKSVALVFGFDIFGLHFRRGSLRYTAATSTTPERYTGELTLQVNTPLGNNFTVEAEWNQTDGFKITKWPIIPQIPNINPTKLLEAAKSGNACDALGSLGLGPDIIKGELKTSMRVSAPTGSTPSSQKSKPAAIVSVDFTYIISIAIPGTSAVALNANAKPLTVSFTIESPESASFDVLAGMIVNAIGSVIAGVFTAIVDDPAAMGRLIAAVTVQKLTNQAISSLICRNIEKDALETELKNRTNPNPDEPNDGDKNVKKEEDGVRDADSANGAAAAAAAADGVMVAGGIAIGFFASLLSALLSVFGIETDESRKARERRDYAHELQNRARDAVKKKLVVTGGTITYNGGGRLRVSWNPVKDAGFYTASITVSDPGGGNAKTIAVTPPLSFAKQTAYDIQDSAISPGRHIVLSVQASIQTQNRYDGDPASFASDIADFGPHQLAVEQQGSTLVAVWRGGPQHPDSYDIRVTVDKGPSITQPNFAPYGSGFRTVVPAASLHAGTTYTVTVQAKKAGAATDPVAATPILYSVLSAPTGFVAQHASGTTSIDAAWSQPSTSPGVVVQVYKTDHFNLVLSQSVVTGNSATLTNPAFVKPAQMLVRVGSRGAAAGQTVWGEFVTIVLHDLAKPAVSAVTCSESDLKLRWNAVPDAASYEVKASSSPLITQPIFTVLLVPPPGSSDPASNYPCASCPLTAFEPGATVTVQVRAIADGSLGPWSDPTAVAQVHIPDFAPTNCVIEQVNDALYVSWQAADSGSYTYRVRLEDAHSQPLSTAAQITIDQAKRTAVLQGPTLTNGATFRAGIQAQQSNRHSAWVSTPPITLSAASTALQFAQRQKAAGLTCQQAAPPLIKAFPSQSASDLATLFLKVFPETTGTALLLLWALELAGIKSNDPAIQTPGLFPQANQDTWTRALKTVYPQAATSSAAKALAAAGTNPITAANHLRTVQADLTPTQMGWLLLAYPPLSDGSTLSLVHSLTACFDMNGAAQAARDLFPLLAIDDLAYLLQTVVGFPTRGAGAPQTIVTDATQVAKALFLAGFTLAQIAPALVSARVYPNLSAVQLGQTLGANGLGGLMRRLAMRALLESTGRYQWLTVQTALNQLALQEGSLIGQWFLQESSGAIAKDVIDNHDGKLMEGAVFADAPHPVIPTKNNALHILHLDRCRVSFGSFVADFGTADFSLAFRMMTVERKLTFNVIGNRLDLPAIPGGQPARRSTNAYVSLRLNDPNGGEGKLFFEVSQPGAQYGALAGSADVADGKWHEIVAVRLGATLMLKVDGVSADKASTTATEGPPVPANILTDVPLQLGGGLVDRPGNLAGDAYYQDLMIFVAGPSGLPAKFGGG
jgi:hypothetical protein